MKQDKNNELISLSEFSRNVKEFGVKANSAVFQYFFY
jgi:hypothetical protein